MPRTPSSRSDAAAAAESFRHVVQALRLSAAAVERAAGVTSAQLLVLRVLARVPGLALGEIARRALTDLSSVSVVVSKLVARGLVARERDERDGRRVRVSPTTGGRRLLATAPASAPERLLAAIESLPPAARRGLARGLAAVVARMGLGSRPAPLFFEDGRPRSASGKPARRQARR